MSALASIDLDVLLIIARKSMESRQIFPYTSESLVVCPWPGWVLPYASTEARNALHMAALQYAARLWDQDRDDASMVQFLLEFRAWIDTPGRTVTL